LALVSGQAQHLGISYVTPNNGGAYGLRLSGFNGLTGFVVAGDAGKVEAELDASALLLISFILWKRSEWLTKMIRKSLGFPLFIML